MKYFLFLFSITLVPKLLALPPNTKPLPMPFVPLPIITPQQTVLEKNKKEQVQAQKKRLADKQSDATIYPGLLPFERTLIRQALLFPSKEEPFLSQNQKWGPPRMVFGKFFPRVCEQVRQHARYLAQKNLQAPLRPALALYNVEQRENALVGDYFGHRGLGVKKYQEIVFETHPTLDPKEAAKACMDGWYTSEESLPILTTLPLYYCATMEQSKNGRFYCVAGILTK